MPIPVLARRQPGVLAAGGPGGAASHVHPAQFLLGPSTIDFVPAPVAGPALPAGRRAELDPPVRLRVEGPEIRGAVAGGQRTPGPGPRPRNHGLDSIERTSGAPAHSGAGPAGCLRLVPGGKPPRRRAARDAHSDMSDHPTEGRRQEGDRRRRPTSPCDALRRNGRRSRPRRRDERRGAFFVDRFDAPTLAMVVALLCLTILDGVLTLELLELNSVEVNPVMAHLLTRGPIAFLVGKYTLTAAGLPFLVVYQHHEIFGSRFRVGWLVPLFIRLYFILLFHQWTLLHAGPSRAEIRGGDSTGSTTSALCWVRC